MAKNSPSSSGSVSHHSTASFESSIRSKKCKGHDMEANLYTSYTEDNPGRRFFRCPVRELDDCKYIEWLDDDIPPQYKVAAARVVRRNFFFEAQLKQKIEKEAMLKEKLTMVEGQLSVVDETNKELQNGIKDLQRSIDNLLHLNESLIKEKKMLQESVMTYKGLLVLLLIFMLVAMVHILSSGGKAKKSMYMLP